MGILTELELAWPINLGDWVFASTDVYIFTLETAGVRCGLLSKIAAASDALIVLYRVPNLPLLLSVGLEFKGAVLPAPETCADGALRSGADA